MLRITTVAVDGSRITGEPRSRLYAGNTPELTWGADASNGAGRQTAFRIRWAYAKPGMETVRRDTGWVHQEEQRWTLKGEEGPSPLSSITFTLTIRDDQDEESEPYTATVYNADCGGMGAWIGPKEDTPKRTVYLRREFTVEKQLQSAVLYACGIGYHQLYLNGDTLDDAALEPAFTDYSKAPAYVVYPLLHERLTPGLHCLAAMVGDGWRRNSMTRAERYPQRPEGIPFAGRPLFRMAMVLIYQDGMRETILSDDAWQVGTGMLWENDLFDGETWDARRAQPGWNLTGFSGFDQAQVLPGPTDAQPMLIPPIRPGETHAPLTMWQIGEATVIDFGHNLAGVVRLSLPGGMREGHTIRVMHAEELTEDGDLFTDPLRGAKATDTYTAAGDARDLAVWQPLFTYHGFRYVKVEGIKPKPDSILAVSLHTDMELHSHFRCGDALVTAIHNACVATERANQHSILTDCPQRDERMGWLNDATVRFEETPYNFDIGRMFPKIVRDVMDAQGADGAITCTAPYVFGSRPADPVSSSFLVAAWQHYLFTGSSALLREGFPRFIAWQECLMRNSRDHIVSYSHYGDWAGPADCCTAEENARSALTPGEFMSTGYSYYNCVLIERMAQVLKDQESVEWARSCAQDIKKAMLSRWFDPVSAKMATGSQACQAFALWLGIIPPAYVPHAAMRLHDELEGNGHRITTGNLCTRYLMDVLCEYGYVDDAWALITRQEYPGWGYMLQNEATTIWERFELKKHPGMNSHSHPMYGAVDSWLYAYIAGIKPQGPGFARFEVKPHMPTNLLSAQAVVDTVKGDVAVRWMKRYSEAHLHVTVPFGTTARVHFLGQVHEAAAGFHTFHAALPVQGGTR